MNSAVETIYKSLLHDYPLLESCANAIVAAYEAGVACYENGGTVLVCGNGGSAADSEHIVGELMKGFMQRRELSNTEKELFPEGVGEKLQGALPAISLVSQSGIITAYANDVDPDMIFAQQVYGYRNPNSLVIGISTSGNSANVVNALSVAKGCGMKTMAFLGKDGGVCAEICDVPVIVPAHSTPKIQELHLPVYHAWCAMLEAHFFPLEEK